MKQKTTKLYRQGDVLFRQIERLPNGQQKKRENATVAYGEVTGHSHAIAVEDRCVAEVLEIGDGLYVSVSEAGVRLTARDQAISDAMFGGPTSSDLIQEAMGATFVHEEHGPITLPPGNYQVTIQREYSPEEIRNVVD